MDFTGAPFVCRNVFGGRSRTFLGGLRGAIVGTPDPASANPHNREFDSRAAPLRLPPHRVSTPRRAVEQEGDPMARSRTFLALPLLLIALVGGGGASAAPTAAPFGPNVIVFDPSMPVGADPGDPRRDPRPAGRRRDGHEPLRAPVQARHVRHRRRSRCRSRSATTPRSPAWARRRPTSSSTARSRSTTAASTTAARATASRWSTSGARCPTCRSTSTPPARTAAARRRTSGRSRRRCRCAGSTSRGGNLSLMDYCTAGPQYASGGFIADSNLPDRDQRLAAAVADPQQRGRRLVQRACGTRSSRASRARRPTPAFPNPPYTTLETTPVSREKPYLFVDAAGEYQVRVPVGADEHAAASPGPTA